MDLTSKETEGNSEVKKRKSEALISVEMAEIRRDKKRGK